MPTRLFALIAGLAYFLVGFAGFMPALVWRPDMPRLGMNDLRLHGGEIAGFLAVNWAHNIMYLLIGIAGLASFIRLTWARAYAQGLFILSVLFVIVGLLPLGIGDFWGYLPLSGWNVPIHTITAILAWYYGMVYPQAQELQIAA